MPPPLRRDIARLVDRAEQSDAALAVLLGYLGTGSLSVGRTEGFPPGTFKLIKDLISIIGEQQKFMEKMERDHEEALSEIRNHFNSQ